MRTIMRIFGLVASVIAVACVAACASAARQEFRPGTAEAERRVEERHPSTTTYRIRQRGTNTTFVIVPKPPCLRSSTTVIPAPEPPK